MPILPLLGETDPITYTPAAAAGDEFDNADGVTELEIWNRAGISLRVEFVEQRNCSFGEKGVHVGRIETIPPGSKLRVRHFHIWRYNNKSKRVEIIYPDGATGLELAALFRPCL